MKRWFFIRSKINLIGPYSRVLVKNSEYRGEKSRIPINISSTAILSTFILSTLHNSREEMYGYKILTNLKELFDGDVWSPSTGSVYPTIRELVRDGLIESYKLEHNKKIIYYKITEAGIDVLNGRVYDLEEKLTSTENFFKGIKKAIGKSNEPVEEGEL